MDDLVAQFTSITSADPERAAQYLTLTDGNFEQAIQLFFDSPNLDMGGPEATQEPATQQPASRSATTHYTEDAQGVVHIESDDDADEDFDLGESRPAQQAAPPTLQSNLADTYEDDEAMARRMQEEIYAGGNVGGGFEGEEVRAPMARTTETLVGPGADWGSDPGDMRAAIAEQLLARQRRVADRRGIFNQRSSPSVWDEDNADPAARRRNLSQATAGASDMNSKSNKLAEMYRPPFEIMTRLPWDQARDEGKEQEKWLLVNVQDASIFDCQILNRDIWKNDQIKDTIKENFFFMQYSKDDPAGEQYINYYFHARDSDDAYPHIAIVDPRTGEQVKVWSGRPAPKPMDFLMQLHEFLDRYSLNVAVRNPVATRKPERRKEMEVERMTEEEMLEMALQNSLANNGGPRDHDPDALTKSDDGGKGKQKAAPESAMDIADTAAAPSTNGASSSTAAASPFSLISSTHPHAEPPNDPSTTTRIQFRYSGGRQIRRFALADPVRRIYEWLKAAPLEGKEGVEFELKFMGRDLSEVLDRSIGEAGLRNGTVMVEFLDD